MVLHVLALGLLLEVSTGATVALSRINGTNRLFVGEEPVLIVTYRNVGPSSVMITRRERFEVSSGTNEWRECPGPGKFTTGVGGWSESSFRTELQPGGEVAYTIDNFAQLCPGLSDRPGTFELRVVETLASNERIASASERVQVVEPQGIDAQALVYLREKGRSVGSGREFLARFSSSAYAAPFLMKRPPTAGSPPLGAWGQSLRAQGNRGQLKERNLQVSQFLEKNPDHLFAPELRKEGVAVAFALGDVLELERAVSELQAHGAPSADSRDAADLLAKVRGAQGQ